MKNNKKMTKSNKIVLVFTIILDVLIAGVVLLVFAFFHHVLPAVNANEGVKLNQEISQSRTDSDIKKSDVVEKTIQPVISAEPTAQPVATEKVVYDGAFGEKFKDKFTDGEPLIGKTSYIGKNINIDLKIEDDNDGSTFYIADIFVRDVEYLKSAFAGGEFREHYTDQVENMAKENGAIFAVSADYCGGHPQGEVARNGVLYRDKTWEDVCVLYTDGSMKTYTNKEFELDEHKNEGIWHIWTFGPKLLDNDGNPMTEFNSSVKPRNERMAIGCYEPGHYCFVMIQGNGLAMKDLSQYMYELGCETAYNLDGGNSAQMVLNGIHYGGTRSISDIIYMDDTMDVAEG